MFASAAIASILLLALGLAMRLFGLEGGADVLAVGFSVLVVLPVVRLLWVLVELAQSKEWVFVLVGLLVIGLLLSAFVWPVR